jgi:spermidine synthase
MWSTNDSDIPASRHRTVRRPQTVVGLLLAGSGCCALVYQVSWLREFRLIFGASTAASAAVLAIFAGGLGAGALLLARRIDRDPRPLRLYAALEGIVAASAAVSPWLLSSARSAYVAAGGTASMGAFFGTIVRLLLAALVLAGPTLAMGGTLPAAARSIARRDERDRESVAWLYGLNTIGAVAGCLTATFLLLEQLGTSGTIRWMAALNGLIALAAWQIDRTFGRAWTAPVEGASHPSSRSDDGPRAEGGVSLVRVLIASAATGFVFFLMEIVWYRMLGPLLGGSLFTFGLILAVALAGIGTGGLAYALLRTRHPATLTAFVWTCLLEAAALAVPFAIGDPLALLVLAVHPVTEIGFAWAICVWTAVALIVVFPAAVAAGYQFPLLIALAGRSRASLGHDIGAVYAANTAGAIAGSLAGGFGLLPWLSAPGLWRVCIVTLAGLGASALALSMRGGRWKPVIAAATKSDRSTGFRQFAPAAALVAASLASACATGPTAIWRQSGIGAGRARIASWAWNPLHDWMHAMRRAIVWAEDGTESSVALSVEPAGYAFIVNGKGDGSARLDAGTQIMLGLVGALLHPDPRRALVIGLGTGSTAGWLGAVHSIDQVDVVELEPLVIDVARACDEVNRDVLHNPKVRITIGDAREALLTERGTYDLIASEPSNPFRAGVASLFTREYYEAARRRLNDEGLFLQWVQLYEIDASTLQTVYATLADVFPHIEVWQVGASDVMLVGAKRPLEHSAALLAERIGEEPFRTALRAAWRGSDLQDLLAHYVANERLTPLLVRQPGVHRNTDDRNLVEFGFARSMGAGESLAAQLRALAKAAGRERPLFTDAAPIDWDAVESAWVAYQSAEGQAAGLEAHGPPEERARQTAVIHYYRDHDLDAARRAWSSDLQTRNTPTELAMRADVQADSGSDDALGSIERLRAFGTGEAEVLLATLRARQERFEDAAAALEEAFDRFRADPWALTLFKQRAIALAGTIALRSPQIAARMQQALIVPFAIRAVQDDRLVLLATLARRLGMGEACRDAVAALDPAPWTLAFLTSRRDCFRMSNDRRLAAAERDLAVFREHEAESLVNVGKAPPSPGH